MNEIRSYASLSGSLLARKGGAKPAMRPRPLSTQHMLDDLGWDDMGEAPDPAPEHVPSSIAALTPAPRAPAPEQVPAAITAVSREPRQVAGLTPAPRAPAPVPVQEESPPVHVQQRVLAEHYEQQLAVAGDTPPLSEAVIAALRAPSPKRKGKASEAQAAGRKAAFTLRLDADRHLRLRLASALTGRSSQQLVTAALDTFIQTLPEVGALAQQVPAGAGRHS
jgi:type IV secretory pathway VirB10-like protein